MLGLTGVQHYGGREVGKRGKFSSVTGSDLESESDTNFTATSSSGEYKPEFAKK